MTDRFADDLNRAREYIEAARPRVHVPQADGDACPSCGQLWDWHLDETGCRVGDPAYFDKWTEQPANLTDALFGEYTCKRCNSYLHDENVHRSQYGEAPPPAQATTRQRTALRTNFTLASWRPSPPVITSQRNSPQPRSRRAK